MPGSINTSCVHVVHLTFKLIQGGHFAALEQPSIFLQNIEEFLAVARPLIGL